MRALIIEDEPAIAGDIESALAEAGYVADVARDGEEGWFRASTEEYDAVVLDLGLPKLDGLSVVRRLREEASLVPILVLTARGAWLRARCGRTRTTAEVRACPPDPCHRR